MVDSKTKARLINSIILLMMPFIYVQAQCLTIEGRVMCGQEGVGSVVVTDGTHFTQTDQNGNYQLSVTEKASFVYLSTPSGYLPERRDSRPLFFQTIDRRQIKEYNFRLERNSKDDRKHTVMVHADPQLYKSGNLNDYQRILSDCKQFAKENKRELFGIDCGDLVGDKPELYESYITAVDQLDVPFYRVMGNHDMTLYGRSHETSYTKFESLFGPSYYSFNKGKAHYIVLNDVFYLSRDYFYAGYIDERQLAWLEKDLSYVDKDHLIFVAIHIPTRLEVGQVAFEYSNANIAGRVSNAESLYRLLKPYRAHILSGHTHYNRNLEHSDRLFEHITAAICGTWWQGDVCLDGTPQGYGVYEVNDNDVTWFFKSAGHPKEYQFRAYPLGCYTEYPNDVIVNVWNWDVKWKVEWLENGVLMGDLSRINGHDFAAKKLCADKEKLEFKWITPMTNEHMFRAPIKNQKALIEIRVTDRFGRVYQSKVN